MTFRGGLSAVALLGLGALAGCTTASVSTSTTTSVTDLQADPELTSPDRRVNLRLQLAAAYLQSGQPTVALEEIKQALAINPNSAAAYSLRGMVYQQMGSQPLAEESFRRAVALNPRDGDTLHNYGAFLCESNRYQDGVGYLRQALAQPLYVNAARSWMVLGSCQSRAGDTAGALDSLKRAFALDSTNPSTLYQLSSVLLQQGNALEAQYYFSRLRAVGGNDAAVLWLGIRIANASGNRYQVDQLGADLVRRFPDSNEAAAYTRGDFRQ